jgi:hypothetical protein
MVRSLAARTALLEARQREAFRQRVLACGANPEEEAWWMTTFWPARHRVYATIVHVGDGWYEYTRATVDVLMELSGRDAGGVVDWLADQLLALPADQRSNADHTPEQVRAGLREQLGVSA